MAKSIVVKIRMAGSKKKPAGTICSFHLAPRFRARRVDCSGELPGLIDAVKGVIEKALTGDKNITNIFIQLFPPKTA